MHTTVDVPQPSPPAPRRRRLGVGIMVAGVALSIVSITGALAAFTDTAKHGSNSFATAAIARPVDIRINETSPNANPQSCVGSSDDVDRPALTYDGSDLTIGPGTRIDLTPWHNFCVENVGRTEAVVSLRAIEVADVEVACTGFEVEVDTTCGRAGGFLQAAGELREAVRVEIRVSPRTNGCHWAAPGTSYQLTFAELATTNAVSFKLGLQNTLSSHSCIAYRLVRATSDENVIQAAQSDRLTWRFQVNAVDAASVPPPIPNPDA